MRDFRSVAGRGPFIFIAAALTLSSALIGNSQAGAAESVFDELRFGATTSIGDGSNQEDGVFPSVTVFFDPLGAGSANGLAEKSCGRESMPAPPSRPRRAARARSTPA